MTVRSAGEAFGFWTRMKVWKPEPVKPARAADLERFTELLDEALRLSGYVNPRTAKSTEEKVRRLVRRLHLPARDAEVWFGILRQILYGLRSSASP